MDLNEFEIIAYSTRPRSWAARCWSGEARGWLVSAAVHVSLAALLAWGPDGTPPMAAGRQVTISLEATHSPSPAGENEALDEPPLTISVSPTAAEFPRDRFVRIDGVHQRLPELPPSITGEPAPQIPPRRDAPQHHRPADAVAAAVRQMPQVARATAAEFPFPPLSVAEESQAVGQATQPRAVSNRPPAYPNEAVLRRLEGSVSLRLHVSSEGVVTAVDVARSSGHPLLDAAAVRAVRTWRYEPARRGGAAVACYVSVQIDFHLRRGPAALPQGG